MTLTKAVSASGCCLDAGKATMENRPIGYFGQLRKEYLCQAHLARYQILLLRGKLWNYLDDMNEQAQEQLAVIIEK